MAENRSAKKHGPGVPPEKAKDFKGSMRKLLKYAASYKLSLILIMLLSGAATVLSVIGPKILGNATTELYNGLSAKLAGTGGIDFTRIYEILSWLILLYTASALFSFVESWLTTQISQNLCYKLRKDISEKINRIPLAYYEKRQIGDTLSRITNDVDTLGSSLTQAASQIISSVFTLIGVLVMMLSISPLMTCISLGSLPVSGILIAIVVKLSQKYFVQNQEYLGKIDGQIEETFSGHNIVKAFNRENTERENFGKLNEKLYEAGWKSSFLSGLMHPVMSLVGNLGYLLVAVIGASLAAAGSILIGDIVAFIQYVKKFNQPITQVARISSTIQSMAAASERVFEFLALDEENNNALPSATSADISGQVSFDHVSFGYLKDTPVIHDFSCEVKPGQMVAIVGPTGAGKTTMVKLLMRFYDVDSGSISLDGHNVRDFARSDLRECFGMVLQDTWLFHDTIMENIRYGRLDSTDEEVIAAAKAAYADNFIRALPDGYNMVLNEDASNVSQGQKQLLTIARAILADNKILILDEATSSVDTRTELLIQNAMANLMKGRTSFVIAHRLSTIKGADNILVMKSGDIVEQGTHEELLSANGFYAELYHSQFEDIG